MVQYAAGLNASVVNRGRFAVRGRNRGRADEIGLRFWHIRVISVRTTPDAANREAVRVVARADLDLVGLAMRAERKVIDKIIDGLKFHS